MLQLVDCIMQPMLVSVCTAVWQVQLRPLVLSSCFCCAGISWQGRAHSGIDDAINTANLAIHLMRQDVRFEVTQVSENPLVQQQLGSQGRAGLSASAAAGAAANSSPADAQGAPSKGRSNMTHKAAQQGLTGVDASGRWLGRCFCGTKAKSRVTKRPGPNHGRSSGHVGAGPSLLSSRVHVIFSCGPTRCLLAA
jgi:hypothetical protein